MKGEEYLYKDLSHDIIGCAFDTFKTVGVGFNEIIYHRIFHSYLNKKGITAEYKKNVELCYSGEVIARHEIDEIVENKIIVELKCIQSNFIPANYAQILTYLKLTGKKLGILINFGLLKAVPKRILFDNRVEQNWQFWDNSFFADKKVGGLVETLQLCLNEIDETLGPSYHRRIYQAALRLELQKNQLNHLERVFINAEYDNTIYQQIATDYWTVESVLMVGVTSGNKRPRGYDLIRMRSYLRKMGIHHGIIAFWSSTNLQVYGIYEP